MNLWGIKHTAGRSPWDGGLAAIVASMIESWPQGRRLLDWLAAMRLPGPENPETQKGVVAAG